MNHPKVVEKGQRAIPEPLSMTMSEPVKMFPSEDATKAKVTFKINVEGQRKS